jgi:peptidoglycan/LPS O-acetylase OafA/YrhL
MACVVFLFQSTIMHPVSVEAEDAKGYASYLSTRAFGSLDGLRAAAILAVVWHHTPHETTGQATLLERCFLGVDLFFVISGFLIVTLLLRERRRTGDISLRGFYARRFLRIFPAYYATLALVAVLAFVGHGSEAAALRHDLPYALFYVSNLVSMTSMLTITWSLSTEEQFYLIIPALKKYLRGYVPALLIFLYVLLALPTFGFFPSWNLPVFFRQTTFGPILLGVLLAHVLDDPRGFAWFWRLLHHGLSPLLAAALLLLVASYPAEDISGWLRMAIHFSMVLLVASCVVRERHVLRPVLSFWPIRRIGIVSYGIYLFHKLVRHIVDKGLGHWGVSSSVVFFLALALASWAVAELSYRYFESRFLALKSRFSH